MAMQGIFSNVLQDVEHQKFNDLFLRQVQSQNVDLGGFDSLRFPVENLKCANSSCTMQP